jgi:hypothetical protein
VVRYERSLAHSFAPGLKNETGPAVGAELAAQWAGPLAHGARQGGHPELVEEGV